MTEKGRLDGKIALVTAAGAGIGREIALRFAREGATVIATNRRKERLDGMEHVGEIRQLDVRNTQQVNQLASDFPRIDVLCNCAGHVHVGTVLDCTEKDWDDTFDLNVKSMHRTIAAFLPGMVKVKSGSIINIASVISSVRSAPNRYAYGASKAAIIGLTKAVAADYIRYGIRCNVICPGTIMSPSLNERINVQALKEGRSKTEVRQDFMERQPIGRLGTTGEVAALALYLASDEALYTTGQVHVIDGGYTI